ncbi:DUF2141 domain-containing protein [Rhodocista pekingensis]|uniref:DUF2141 domain-containing protein n=1 Tax=Rhodocista pekingensis TaxID=201185 RepID=A0ABW2KTM0_9PROT
MDSARHRIIGVLTAGALIFPAGPVGAEEAVQEPAAVVVRVTGIRHPAGMLYVGICSAATFLKPTCDANQGQRVDSVSDHVFRFEDLPSGTYAVQVLHDTNGDGKMEQDQWGAPLEPTGFSRDAIGYYGPPDFESAAFAFDGKEIVISVKIR